jgi:hypothetical protein
MAYNLLRAMPRVVVVGGMLVFLAPGKNTHAWQCCTLTCMHTPSLRTST